MGYFTHYRCIGDDDNEQGDEIHRQYAEQIVGDLLSGRREKTERYALIERWVFRMGGDVENNALKQKYSNECRDLR